MPAPDAVYNLRVAPDHAYYANSILVHNCDDPHDVAGALSDVQRDATLIWWDEQMSTRLNQADSGKIIVMQRLHDRDLGGHVLEQGGYEHLCLPMEFERGRRCTTSIGWKDPRKKEGALLWPKRFPRKKLKDLRVRLGSYGYAGQMQQRPAPRGGGLFEVERFKVVRSVPGKVVASCRAWDKAGTDLGGDYSAGVLMSKLDDGRFIVRDVVRGQWSAGKREATIRQTAEIDGVEVTIRVEQEPGSGGKESAENTVRNLAGFRVEIERPSGDKALRAEPHSIQVEGGNVLLLRAEWNRPFIEEHRGFPTGAHDDQVDAAASAFNELAGAPPPLELM